MDFENDIFISYAHIDNLSLDPNQEGWIAAFNHALAIRLAQLRGQTPRIWRDPKLQGNDYFSDTILEQFPKVALLVSVLSPRYVKSEWCLRELQHFSQAAAQTGGVRITDKSRIFKVIKTHLPLDKQPPELQQLLGYEFYEFDQANRPREFGKTFGPDSERKYWAKLEDLAYDIYQLLETLETVQETQETGGQQTESAPAEPAGKTIYLAETPFELEDERDQIKRELQLAGHTVLPEHPLPYTPDFPQVVERYLAECVLSIHLVTCEPAAALTSLPTSSTDLQRRLAAVRSREQIDLAAARRQAQPNFTRILWTPPTDSPSTSPSDPAILTLQKDPDFLSTELEDLKTYIQDRLNPPPQQTEPTSAASNGLQVYLDCDQQDLEAPDIEPLFNFLDQQFQIVLPDYAASGVTQSENQLRQCNAVLIYYGQTSGLWLKRRLLALKKTLYGRLKPLLAKAVYVAAPVTPSKQQFTDPEVPIIQGFETFSPNLLAPFLTQVSQKSGGMQSW